MAGAGTACAVGPIGGGYGGGGGGGPASSAAAASAAGLVVGAGNLPDRQRQQLVLRELREGAHALVLAVRSRVKRRSRVSGVVTAVVATAAVGAIAGGVVARSVIRTGEHFFRAWSGGAAAAHGT